MSACIVVKSPELLQSAWKQVKVLVPVQEFEPLIDLLKYIDILDSHQQDVPYALIDLVAGRLLEIRSQWSWSKISFIAHRFSAKTLRLDIHNQVCQYILECSSPDVKSPVLLDSPFYFRDEENYIYPQNSALNSKNERGLSILLNSLLQSKHLSDEVRAEVNKYLRCILTSCYMTIPSKTFVNLGLSLSVRENFDRDLMCLYIKAANSYGAIDYNHADNWKTLRSFAEISRNLSNLREKAEGLPELVVEGQTFT